MNPDGDEHEMGAKTDTRQTGMESLKNLKMIAQFFIRKPEEEDEEEDRWTIIIFSPPALMTLTSQFSSLFSRCAI